MRRRALVLGIHSFLDSPTRVGIQYIAEGLADAGWRVDYVSRFSSPFDVWGPARRRRLRRVWVGRQDVNGAGLRPGLREYAFRAPFPAHPKVLRAAWQVGACAHWAPAWLRRTAYDVCVHDVTANIVYLPLVRSRFTVLRLNDLPEGFGRDLSPRIIDLFRAYVRGLRYDEIWAAHEPLVGYALSLNPENRVAAVPNGVDPAAVSPAVRPGAGRARHAVYLGSVDRRVDLELLDRAAALLPDWRLDVVGPVSRPWTSTSPNLRRLPPVPRHGVRACLEGYQVGLIPFRDTRGGLAYVQRPLKFLEYVGAGLGVASTDVGALRSGMGEWASYGNTPEAFAAAVVREAARARQRPDAARRELLAPYAWPSVVRTLCRRLDGLERGGGRPS